MKKSKKPRKIGAKKLKKRISKRKPRKKVVSKKAARKSNPKKRKRVIRRGPRSRAGSLRGRVFSPEKVAELVDKGKERGFVTMAEILYFFPEMEKDVQGLENLYEVLEKGGVEVKETKGFLQIQEESGKKAAKVLE
ncbi:MAG: RNA polymerase sigma factor SigA, partial [Parcubacteria group bacterium Gr01-1014_30]